MTSILKGKGTAIVLDQDTAAKATDALAAAITALLERGVDAATTAPEGLHDFMNRAESLKHVADDAMVLVAALIVLARRADLARAAPAANVNENFGASPH